MKRIVYKNDLGALCVIIPAEKCGLTIEQIAKKDVPSGIAYKIINASDLPDDRSNRDEWDFDMSSPDGYGD